MKRNLWNDFQDFIESLQTNGKSLLIFSIGVILLMGIITVGVFFLSVKGSEEVMVPDVTGKELSAALLDMQIKELYPKIQLRYSNLPEEKGCVLEQNPQAGAIVKAGKRVDLVVSRGVVIDKVENYVGQKVDDVKMHLQSLFTSAVKALIVIDEPVMYSYNTAEAGTILEQDPLPDTNINEPIKLKLVVSRGPEHEKAKVPNLMGLSVNDTLLQMTRSKIIFDFTSRFVENGETPGVVVSQLPNDGSWVDTYSRVSAVLAFPKTQNPEMMYGIFEEELPAYPYALEIKLDALTPEGESYNIVSMMHPGGKLTIPYAAPRNTILTLSIYEKEALRKTVE